MGVRVQTRKLRPNSPEKRLGGKQKRHGSRRRRLFKTIDYSGNE